MAIVTEIAPDVYRISIHVPEIDFQFNHFLIRDEQPLLFHTGLKAMFPLVRDAVATLIDPTRLRWISFSHFESDECGSLNEWLGLAPHATAACNVLQADLNVTDFAIRPPRAFADGEVLTTGKYRHRFCSTAHLPHGWDSGVIFEETQRTLLCSDLFAHFGNVEPVTESDVVGRAQQTLRNMQATPFAYATPYTPQTERVLRSLASLKPQRLAIMHGSSFAGDGERALCDLATVIKETLGEVETGQDR